MGARGFGKHRLPPANPPVISTLNRRALSRRVTGAGLFDAASEDTEAESADPVDGSGEGHRMSISIPCVNPRDYYMIPHRPLHRNQAESGLMANLVLWDSG